MKSEIFNQSSLRSLANHWIQMNTDDFDRKVDIEHEDNVFALSATMGSVEEEADIVGN